MKTLIAAFAACLAAAACCFLLLSWIGIDKDNAKLVSTIVIGAFPKLREMLEALRKERASGDDEPTVESFREYEISPARATLYVTTFGFAALNLAGACGGLIAGLNGAAITSATLTVFAVTLLVGFPILFLAGRWIGRRCGSHPFLVAVASGVVLRIVATLFDKSVMSAEDYAAMFGNAGGASDMAVQIAVGSLMFSSMFVGGVLLGRRQRLTAYLGYLIKQLPPENRLWVVDLAYAEARRIQLVTQTEASTPRREPSGAWPA